ncbi:MAG: sugar ABC transporter permease [Anaerolineae bacterium]|nr:MAG: sugar ABC transporter permease [Anaerolineae bacterium]
MLRRQSQAEQPERGTREDRIMKRVFLSPTVALLLALSIFPMIWSLGISITDMQRGGSTTQREAAVEGRTAEGAGFLGQSYSITTRNYSQLFKDERLHIAARNTLFYVIVGVAVQYLIGFALAIVLNQEFFGRSFFRTLFLLPMMMTPVAAAYTGRMMFDSRVSPIAHVLRMVSRWLERDKTIVAPWLTDTDWARVTIVLIDSWQWIPFMTLILLAGLQAIPDDIYEAARVDGANALQLFRRITFPLMLPVSATVILIRGLEIFKIIDIIVVTTGGGPGSSTESLTMYIFSVALTFGNYGYAAAISYMLLVLVIIFATVFLALVRLAQTSRVRTAT